MSSLESPQRPEPAAPPARPAFQPLYAQIKQLLIERVLRGDWQPGELLPSEIKLAAQYGVSQGTVRKALEEMGAENLVLRQQGKGTFVATNSTQHRPFHFIRLRLDEDPQARPSTRFLSCRQAAASVEERERLALAKGAEVVRLRRLRLYGETPAIVEHIALAAGGFPGLAAQLDRVLPDSIYSLLEQQYRTLIVKAVERIRAVAADARDAKLLGLSAGAPLLEVDRLALALDGRAVEWRISRCDTRHLHYANEVT